MRGSTPLTSFYQNMGADSYHPTEATIGPWSSELQHGGPPSALLINALRTFPSTNNLKISRITFEFFSGVPCADCHIKVEQIRPGKKIELLRGQYNSGGRTYMLAHAWRMETLEGITEPVVDDFPLPEIPGPQEQKTFPGVEYFPYGEALEWRFTHGSYDRLGPATVWTRSRIPLIEGEELNGLESLILMIDSANGVSAELDIRKWTFVPVDMTLGLYRVPQGSWVGMSASTLIGSTGVGQTSAIAFDQYGCCGKTLQTLFIRPNR